MNPDTMHDAIVKESWGFMVAIADEEKETPA